MAETMKIRFLRDTAAYESPTLYREGEVVALRRASAERWIRRGAAEPAPREQTQTRDTGADQRSDGTDDEETRDLSAFSKEDLLAHAEALGVEVSSRWTKQEIVDAIDAAREADGT